MPQPDQIAPLHGLRGIAVLFVLVSHIGSGLFPFPHGAIGKVGVWIFFSLSAFLLTSRLVARVRLDGWMIAVGQYLFHRVFRIYPLFFIVLLLHWLQGAFGLDSVVKHLLLVEGWRELWAIPVEFQYYLVIPVLAALSRISATMMISLLAAASLSYGLWASDTVFANSVFIGPKLLPFLLASLLALWIANAGAPARVGWASVGLLAVCTVVYRHIHVVGSGFEIAPWLSIAMGLSAIGIIAAAHRPSLLARILSTRPLVLLGEISFSVYLLHMFALSFGQRLGLTGSLLAWATVVATLLVAYASYRLIEKPGIAIGRWLASSIYWKRSPAQ